MIGAPERLPASAAALAGNMMDFTPQAAGTQPS